MPNWVPGREYRSGSSQPRRSRASMKGVVFLARHLEAKPPSTVRSTFVELETMRLGLISWDDGLPAAFMSGPVVRRLMPLPTTESHRQSFRGCSEAGQRPWMQTS